MVSVLDRSQDGICRDGAGGLDRFHSQTLSDCRNVFKLGADPFFREVLVTGYGVEENPGGQTGLQFLIVVRAILRKNSGQIGAIEDEALVRHSQPDQPVRQFEQRLELWSSQHKRFFETGQ